ncbi:MAG: aminomethyl-transferring glycine dehydrogenase subunit GcvPB [Candidatus Sericytochromatia bacterium]|nr:aminomethyl-transferring glycine dehydrogenase subunit GcvPB [Candidatus Sericytochromatia bacterium]
MEKLIFDKSIPGHRGVRMPEAGVPGSVADAIPAKFLRKRPAALPELSELEVVRHFTRLSHLNYAIDTGFYPLGSCTMKYNPKVNEWAARLEGFAAIHPYQPMEHVQGALQIMYELEQALAAIIGLPAISLQPAAGAHGEFTGLLIIKAYHRSKGQDRRKVLIPEAAHGTNPATASMCGFDVVTIPSDERGLVTLDALKAALDTDVAALMLTNPNTLGLFELDIAEIAAAVHDVGGLVYYDGANLNAIMGWVRPGDMGFDVVHMNLHKTFTTPHGGGGPGTGPVAVRDFLAPFLPTPTIAKRKDIDDQYYFDYERPQSIGKVKGYYGHFGLLVRAYAYIWSQGKGLKEVSGDAVLNANYLRVKLRDAYDLPYDHICMHEFVLSGDRQKAKGANTMAIAKRLIDFGIHPPTVYFPLVVHEAIMIEPTETENKQTLDRFVEVMLQIANEVENDLDLVLSAPHHTPVGKVDEVRAARQPNLRWRPTPAQAT